MTQPYFQQSFPPAAAQNEPHFAMAAPPPAVWPGTQPLVAENAPAHTPRSNLQPSQALLPVGEPPPPSEFTTPPQVRGSPWKSAFILLVFTLICTGVGWQWWEHANAPAYATKSAGGSGTSEQADPEVRRAQAANSVEIAEASYEPPDTAAFTADVKVLTERLFDADTPERRAECFHEGAKHSAEIETLFGDNTAEKLKMRLLALIPGTPLSLPGGQPMPIFKMITSKCSGGALIRLEAGADGKRRIFWPLFFETHQSALSAFLEQPPNQSSWFHVGLRPSHGLDIPAELRSRYLTFDVQVAATSDPHFVACVERDTPLGRFLDRESEWGKVYLSRLLVRRLEIKADALCVVVVDCEGMSDK